MKQESNRQAKLESPYVGVREAAQLLGVSESRLAMAVRLPDGSLGCKTFPSLKRIQDVPGAAGTRGSAILFVREQVVALAEERRQSPRVNTESVRLIPFSEEEKRLLLSMGRPGARMLRMKL